MALAKVGDVDRGAGAAPFGALGTRAEARAGPEIRGPGNCGGVAIIDALRPSATATPSPRATSALASARPMPEAATVMMAIRAIATSVHPPH